MASEAANNQTSANPAGDSSTENNDIYDTEKKWRSAIVRKVKKQPPPQFSVGGHVEVDNDRLLQYGYEMIITERYFDEGRWGWNYKLKDKSNVRQSGVFYETDLKPW